MCKIFTKQDETSFVFYFCVLGSLGGQLMVLHEEPEQIPLNTRLCQSSKSFHIVLVQQISQCRVQTAKDTCISSQMYQKGGNNFKVLTDSRFKEKCTTKTIKHTGDVAEGLLVIQTWFVHVSLTYMLQYHYITICSRIVDSNKKINLHAAYDSSQRG